MKQWRELNQVNQLFKLYSLINLFESIKFTAFLVKFINLIFSTNLNRIRRQIHRLNQCNPFLSRSFPFPCSSAFPFLLMFYFISFSCMFSPLPARWGSLKINKGAIPFLLLLLLLILLLCLLLLPRLLLLPSHFLFVLCLFLFRLMSALSSQVLDAVGHAWARTPYR